MRWTTWQGMERSHVVGARSCLFILGLVSTALSGCNCTSTSETDASAEPDAAVFDVDGGCVKRLNKALHFSGAQYVVALDSSSLHVSDFTIEAWVSFDSVPSFACIMCKPYAGDWADSFALWYEAGGLYAGANPQSTATGIGHTWAPTLHEWHHLALTYHSADRAQNLYIDGVLFASGTAPADPLYDTHSFYIGADVNRGVVDGFFIGTIDEVRIWTSVRAIDDVGRDLRSCAQTSTAGLAAYFPFDEGTGATASDVSGNGNVAELQPSPDAGPTWVDSTVPFH